MSGVAVPGPLGVPFGGQPRVRGSPQEAGSPDMMAVERAEGWAEVRALGSGIVGPCILALEVSNVAGFSRALSVLPP